MLFYALRKYVHDRRIEFPVVLAVSAGFAYLNKFTGFSLPWYIDVAFPCVLFMYLGQYVREKNVEIGGKKTLVLAAVGVVFAAGLTLLFADSAEKYCIDYRVIRLTPFVPVTVGGFALCLALYGALKNVKKKSVLSYIGVNSLLFHLFDNLPEVAVGQAVRMLGVTNVYAVTLCQLAAIILLTPVIVMLVKYFAWFLFGLKKESWSLDYGKLFRVKKKESI